MERKEGLYISTKKLSISTELLLGQMMKGSGLTAARLSSAIYKTEEAIYGELNQEEKETLHYLLQKTLSRIEKSCPDSTIFEK